MFLEFGGGQSDRTHKALSPGTLISHYQIIEEIGAGGMGVVYRAEDTKLKRHVALKFLPPYLTQDADAKRRFIHEAQAASALDHTNICTIYEIGEAEDGQMFISMACYEGETLKMKAERGPLDVEEALAIALQISRGLAKAHGKGIVHRDIKPANIMITSDNVVKIMDFGLAKLTGQTELTRCGDRLGTIAYMSPEQAQGEMVDHRTDIWSLGVVLYEMLTGETPFKGEYEAAVMYSLLNEDAEVVTALREEIPVGLERIVSKALAKSPDDRYQRVDEMAEDLTRLMEDSGYEGPALVFKKPVARRLRKAVFRILVPAAGFIVVLALLVFGVFRVDMGPGKEATAQENSVAIMYFENMVDPEDTDRIAQMVTALLITDLSESEYMRIVSRQRLYDILSLLGKDGLQAVDRTVATEVAERAGVNWILTGSILQTEPNIVLTSDISHVSSGEVRATQRVTGIPGEDIFAVVDKLSREIREDLVLPDAAQKELDRPVADVTTPSPEAYRHYLEGLDYESKLYYTEAQNSYRKALSFDSTFAMAYFKLAGTKAGYARDPQAKQMITRAVEYSDRVSRKEKGYINYLNAYISGNYTQAIQELEKIVRYYPDEKEAFLALGIIHYLVLGNVEEGIRQYTKAIEIDPLYKSAYCGIAYAYDDNGDIEKSIWALNKYMSLAPEEANPYDTRGDLYGRNGNLDQAIESYKDALERKPDLYATVLKLGHMYLFKREFAQAETCYRRLCSSAGAYTRSQGRTCLALVPIYQGKLQKALEILDRGISADEMEQAEGNLSINKHFLKACAYERQGDLNMALKESETCMEIFEEACPYRPTHQRSFYAYILAEAGNVKKAKEVARDLKADIEEKDSAMMYAYWLALGNIELSKGSVSAAVSYLEKARDQAPPDAYFVEDLSMRYSHIEFFLGKAYLEANKLAEAVAVLEKALSRYDEARAGIPISAVETHYLLGLAYERSGWTNKAIEQYEVFLDIWKEADPGIPEVEDAGERLARLKSKA